MSLTCLWARCGLCAAPLLLLPVKEVVEVLHRLATQWSRPRALLCCEQLGLPLREAFKLASLARSTGFAGCLIQAINVSFNDPIVHLIPHVAMESSWRDSRLFALT